MDTRTRTPPPCASTGMHTHTPGAPTEPNKMLQTWAFKAPAPTDDSLAHADQLWNICH